MYSFASAATFESGGRTGARPIVRMAFMALLLSDLDPGPCGATRHRCGPRFRVGKFPDQTTPAHVRRVGDTSANPGARIWVTRPLLPCGVPFGRGATLVPTRPRPHL